MPRPQGGGFARREDSRRAADGRRAGASLEALEVAEVALAQVRLELPRQVARVLLAALKEDARTRVGGERLPGARAQLSQVLVGEHEPEVVAPSFHQHVIEALGEMQVVLE